MCNNYMTYYYNYYYGYWDVTYNTTSLCPGERCFSGDWCVSGCCNSNACGYSTICKSTVIWLSVIGAFLLFFAIGVCIRMRIRRMRMLNHSAMYHAHAPPT